MMFALFQMGGMPSFSLECLCLVIFTMIFRYLYNSPVMILIVSSDLNVRVKAEISTRLHTQWI